MEFSREVSGRVAKAEIRLFDDLHAELLDAHMAEKLRHAENWKTRGVRNYRKPGKCGRKYWKFPNKGNVSNAEFKARIMVPVLEADYTLEMEAESVEQSIAEMLQKSIAESMRNLNKWLEWA